MYSHLVPNKDTLTIFFNNGFIFMNGKLVLDLKKLTAPNDIIQFIVSTWYYVTFR